MLCGAIIGDIAGSRFEFNNIKGKGKSFDLLHPSCKFTDDTVMTCAVAKAIMDSDSNLSTLADFTAKNLRSFGRAYPNRGYGRRFRDWLQEVNPQPYNSCGNGSAMRVSAVGYAAKSLGEALAMAEEVTKVTHNHPEGIKGAQATAACVWMALNGFTQESIGDFIREWFYPIDFTLDEIRDDYKFNELAQDTVPQAIEAFLESTSYEDAINLAITLGGDSDTIAAITGGIAGAYYGVPYDLRLEASAYLPEDLIDINKDFCAYVYARERRTPHE